MTEPTSAEIVDKLAAIHADATEALRSALRAYLETGTPPDAGARALGDFAYPELRLTYAGGGAPRMIRAYARLTVSGQYAATITHPELFRDYLIDQLDLLMADYDVTVEVGRSEVEIPYPYVLDGADDLRLDAAAAQRTGPPFPDHRAFPHRRRVARRPVGSGSLSEIRPLALFDAPRTDFSAWPA